MSSSDYAKVGKTVLKMAMEVWGKEKEEEEEVEEEGGGGGG